jgi:hypothetical protein
LAFHLAATISAYAETEGNAIMDLRRLPPAALAKLGMLDAQATAVCKAWLERLPGDAVLEPVTFGCDGHDLSRVRQRSPPFH